MPACGNGAGFSRPEAGVSDQGRRARRLRRDQRPGVADRYPCAIHEAARRHGGRRRQRSTGKRRATPRRPDRQPWASGGQQDLRARSASDVARGTVVNRLSDILDRDRGNRRHRREVRHRAGYPGEPTPRLLRRRTPSDGGMACASGTRAHRVRSLLDPVHRCASDIARCADECLEGGSTSGRDRDVSTMR